MTSTMAAPVASPSFSAKKTISNNVSDDRPRTQNPAFTAYETKRAACDLRINDIRAQMDGLKNGYSVSSASNLTGKNLSLRSELIEKIKVLRGELKALDDDRRISSNQFAETLEALKKKNADINSAKEKLSFKSTGEIDKRITEIDSTLESGRFTLSEERQMLQEISKLRKMRKALDSMDGSGNDTASLKLRLDQLKMRQGDSDLLIAAKKEQILAVNKQIDEINGIRAAETAKRADTKGEIEKLRRDLDAEYAKKKAAWDEYLQAKAAREASYLRMIARREDQARREAIDDEIDVLEKQLGRLSTESVIDKKWNECTNLINFFTPLVPVSADASDNSSTTAASSSKIRKPAEMDLSKVQIVRKKNDEEEECYFKPSNAKKGKKLSSAVSSNTTPSATDLSKLPFHLLAALTDLALPIPQNVETDLPALLTVLHSRRNDLQEHRDASLAEMDAKRNVILAEIETLRLKLEAKEEQITASTIKKAEKEANAAAAQSEAEEVEVSEN